MDMAKEEMKNYMEHQSDVVKDMLERGASQEDIFLWISENAEYFRMAQNRGRTSSGQINVVPVEIPK
jgi:hypothetical protein